MTARQKRGLLIFLGLATVMIIFIAVGLSRMVFQPGMPLPNFINGVIITGTSPQEAAPFSMTVNNLFKNILLAFLGVNFLFLIYKLVKMVSWRKLGLIVLKSSVAFILVSGAIIVTVLLLPDGKTATTEDLAVFQATPTPESLPMEGSSLGVPPTILFWVVGILLATASILVVVWILRTTRHHNGAIDHVQVEAKRAYLAILSGKDLRNVILTCYQQMTEALKHERGIERESHMTTEEFELLLENEGIPPGPIHQLTRLFEQVRYGQEKPSLKDEKIAVDCLGAIVQYCETLTKGG